MEEEVGVVHTRCKTQKMSPAQQLKIKVKGRGGGGIRSLGGRKRGTENVSVGSWLGYTSLRANWAANHHEQMLNHPFSLFSIQFQDQKGGSTHT